MRLERISLQGFRIHDELEFRPEPTTNVLIGDNGAGKTTILEAIGYLATLASFRRSPDKALVSTRAGRAICRGLFTSSGRDMTIEAEIPAAGRRRVLVNGKQIRSRADIAEAVTLVTFLPDDLDLVKREPGLRRGFVDDLAAQMWPAAAAEQREYERALRQRNALLRSEGRRADPTTLGVWDERLSRLGASVITRRLNAIAALAAPAQEMYSRLSERAGSVSWTYEAAGLGPAVAEGTEYLAEGLLEALGEARPADMDRRMTTVGPHRDEIVFMIDDRDARFRASQGEQRTIALALRVASHQVLSARRGEPPMLLMDDVFSELDAARSRRLVGLLPDAQVFVTSARAEDVPLSGRRWIVEPGRVGAA